MLLIILSDCFVATVVGVLVTFSLINTEGIVCLGEFCKVGAISTWQRDKVEVGELMLHGGVIVCALF
jgi:hypothetical protein